MNRAIIRGIKWSMFAAFAILMAGPKLATAKTEWEAGSGWYVYYMTTNAASNWSLEARELDTCSLINPASNKTSEVLVGKGGSSGGWHGGCPYFELTLFGSSDGLDTYLWTTNLGDVQNSQN